MVGCLWLRNLKVNGQAQFQSKSEAGYSHFVGTSIPILA